MNEDTAFKPCEKYVSQFKALLSLQSRLIYLTNNEKENFYFNKDGGTGNFVAFLRSLANLRNSVPLSKTTY